jgi:hypothetical protein
MIKETVDQYRFSQVLRQDESAKWTRGATLALFDYYEQLSEDTGEDIELDPVAIRCEWSEYPSAVDVLRECDENHYQIFCGINEEENEKLAREWLEERTTVLDVENIDMSDGTFATINSILVREF